MIMYIQNSYGASYGYYSISGLSKEQLDFLQNGLKLLSIVTNARIICAPYDVSREKKEYTERLTKTADELNDVVNKYFSAGVDNNE